MNKPYPYYLLTSVLFFFLTCFNLYAQTTDEINFSTKEYYSLIYQNEVFSQGQKGTVQLPNNYTTIASNEEKIFVKFERTFKINDSSETYNLIIENGINEEGMILINDQFIDLKNNSSKHIISIPKNVLIKGYNTISILANNYTGVGIGFSNIYLINKANEEIDLKGSWNYWIYDDYVNNFESKPTQVVDVSQFTDFDIKNSISNELIDLNWKETDVPVKMESLYSDTNDNGVFWFRNYINFEEVPSGEIYISIPKGIDDYDRIYINEHLIGITNCYSCPRNYKVPKEYLSKKNTIAIMLIDKDGPGGINDRISLMIDNEQIDISTGWKYKKVYDLQILVALQKTDNQSSLFSSPEIEVFNLQGDLIVNDDLNYWVGSYSLNEVLLLVAVLLLITLIVVLVNQKKIKKSNMTDTALNNSNNDTNASNNKYILIRANRVDYKVECLDIRLIESKKDYVKVYLKDNSYMVRKNLKTFLAELPKNHFVRISKFIAVNLNQIDKIDKNLLYLKSGEYHVIGKRYLPKVLQKL